MDENDNLALEVIRCHRAVKALRNMVAAADEWINHEKDLPLIRAKVVAEVVLKEIDSKGVVPAEGTP